MIPCLPLHGPPLLCCVVRWHTTLRGRRSLVLRWTTSRAGLRGRWRCSGTVASGLAATGRRRSTTGPTWLWWRWCVAAVACRGSSYETACRLPRSSCSPLKVSLIAKIPPFSVWISKWWSLEQTADSTRRNPSTVTNSPCRSACTSLITLRWELWRIKQSKSVHCYCFKIWYCQLFVRRQSCFSRPILLHFSRISLTVVFIFVFLAFMMNNAFIVVHYVWSSAAYMA